MTGVEHGVTVHRPRFTLVPAVGGPINPAMIARAVLPLARRLHALAPFDLVDAQFFYPDGPAAAQIAAALGLPLSIKARGADISLWGGKAYALRQMLRAAEQAAGLLAVSEALAGDMAALGFPRDKITVHYTGLDRELFRPLDRAESRARLAQRVRLRPARRRAAAGDRRRADPAQGPAVRDPRARPAARARTGAGRHRARPGARSRALARESGHGGAGAFPRLARPRLLPARAVGRRRDGAALGERRARQRLGRGARLRLPAGDHRRRRRARAGDEARGRAGSSRATPRRSPRRCASCSPLRRRARRSPNAPRASAGKPTRRRWRSTTRGCWRVSASASG